MTLAEQWRAQGRLEQAPRSLLLVLEAGPLPQDPRAPRQAARPAWPHAYDYEELSARDKCSLDVFWLKDDSLLDADNLPEPDVIAEEIAEDLRSAVEQIEEILGDLQVVAE